MLKKYLLPASLALVLVWAAPARASVVLFNPAGGGAVGALSIDVLDPTVGNSIALNANANTIPGASVTGLFQANLGIASLGGVQQFANGTGGNFFTFSAGFVETLVSNSGGSFPTLLFQTGGGGTNFFNMYVNNVAGNNLTGVCFTCGTLVLSGTINASPIPNSNFTVTGGISTPTVPLDQFGNNDYPGVNTLTGLGSFAVTITTTAANQAYFPGLMVGSTLLFATSEEVLPYLQADPSAAFSNNGVTPGNQPGVASVGAVNGLSGPNTMFQSDANISFQTVSAIPEPATLTLFGLGLVGTAVARRRQRKNQK